MSSTATVNLLDQIAYPNSSNNININTNSNNTNNLNSANTNMNTIVDFSVGSMPANYGYDESFSKEDDSTETQFKPRILIMGLRKYVLRFFSFKCKKSYSKYPSCWLITQFYINGWV
jgi:hypothetical protein